MQTLDTRIYSVVRIATKAPLHPHLSWCCNHSRVAEGTRPNPEGVYSGDSWS